MQINTPLLQMSDNWFDRIIMCITLPISTPACRSVWEAVMYASAALGLILACWFAWKAIDYRTKHAAGTRIRQERDSVAAQSTKREHKRTEPVDIAADVTDPHLAKKIRQELEQQRIKNLRG